MSIIEKLHEMYIEDRDRDCYELSQEEYNEFYHYITELHIWYDEEGTKHKGGIAYCNSIGDILFKMKPVRVKEDK